MKLVAAYIDAYNLYHGLKDDNLKRFYWLDISALIQTFIEKDHSLNRIYYFTSPSLIPGSQKRQTTYIEALQTNALINRIDFRVIRGRFMPEDVRCQNCNDVIRCPRSECGEIVSIHHEKETDVNIAVQMISDAYEEVYDTAFLVTGDSDQAGTIKTVRSLFHDTKEVAVIFPPKRKSKELKSVASACWNIDVSKLAKCQLPDPVIKGGYPLCRPANWN